MAKTIFQLVGEYANTVGRYGPDSPEAKQNREAHETNTEFIKYADALDRIKRNFTRRYLKKKNTTLPGVKGAICDELTNSLLPGLSVEEKGIVAKLLDHSLNHPWVDKELECSIVENICAEFGYKVPETLYEDKDEGEED